jgi:hypothetical protein
MSINLSPMDILNSDNGRGALLPEKKERRRVGILMPVQHTIVLSGTQNVPSFMCSAAFSTYLSYFRHLAE